MKFKTTLLSVSRDAKTKKGLGKGVLTGVLYLSPHSIVSPLTLCPASTPGCRAACLFSAGRGIFSRVQKARANRTNLWVENPDVFLDILRNDIRRIVQFAKKNNLKPAIRLNGTSDICWENFDIIQEFPDVQFYDYTKLPVNKRGKIPSNYHLTYSVSESPRSWKCAEEYLKNGMNVAIVFHDNLLKTYVMKHGYGGYKVIDGDLTDIRFRDRKGVVVSLTAKGKAKKDTSGFVRRLTVL